MVKSNFILAGLLFSSSLQAQKQANDAMLHNSQPQYPVLYGAMPQAQIKSVLDKVFNYIEAVTPAQMVNKITNLPVNDVADLFIHNAATRRRLNIRLRPKKLMNS